MLVVTAEQMRELDRRTIHQRGVPGSVLMARAGAHVAEAACALAGEGARVAVVCGNGGNGGDGFVCARLAAAAGRDAIVYLAAGEPRPGTDAAEHLALWRQAGGRVALLGDAAALAAHRDEIAGAALVVDALFGTGLERAVEGHAAAVVEAMGRAALVLAVDLPSGLDANTGHPVGGGACARASVTVTFQFPKVGMVSAPGFARCGDVRVVDIGIPEELAGELGVNLARIEASDAAAWLPRRPVDGHKGTFGHVLVAAGSPGKSGAALLAALGALRGGAGLVTLAVPAAVRATVDGRVPEAMTATFDHEDAAALAALAQGKRAVVWGPGMATSATAGEAVRAAAGTLLVPLVLDADALNHLALAPAACRGAPASRVLTPHPGEAARLLAGTSEDVRRDRVAAARALAGLTGAVVALKGARTVVAAPGGRAAINPTGNPGLGTGGTGDVLAGLVGALLAQAVPAFEAACLGVYVHGLAADLLAWRRGTRGLVASDVAHSLPDAFHQLATD